MVMGMQGEKGYPSENQNEPQKSQESCTVMRTESSQIKRLQVERETGVKSGGRLTFGLHIHV